MFGKLVVLEEALEAGQRIPRVHRMCVALFAHIISCLMRARGHCPSAHAPPLRPRTPDFGLWTLDLGLWTSADSLLPLASNEEGGPVPLDRKSTRLNSSHLGITY